MTGNFSANYTARAAGWLHILEESPKLTEVVDDGIQKPCLMLPKQPATGDDG